MLVVKKVKFSVSDVEHIEVWGFLKNIDYLCHTRQVLEHRSLLPSALDLFQSEIFTRGQYWTACQPLSKALMLSLN